MADKAAKEFDKLGVKVITSSDLPRGAQSAKMIADRMEERPQLIATSRARTWNTGEGGKPEKQSREDRKKYAQMPDVPMPGGESFDSFEGRFRDFIGNELKQAERDPGTQRAIVVHGHQMMHAEKVINGDPAEDKDFDKLDDLKPGHVAILSVENGHAKLSPVGETAGVR